jgi:hypothetical protein
MSAPVPPPPPAPPAPLPPAPPPRRRSREARGPEATVVVLGVVLVIAALLTLCGAGMLVVKPEAAIGADTLAPTFEVGAARHAYYLWLVLWMLLAILQVVAGALLVARLRLGRLLGLVWAWATVGAFLLMALANTLFVLPRLDEAGLSTGELVRTMIAGPTAGCCPVTVSLIALFVLYLEGVTDWATARTPSRSSSR